MGKLTEEQCDMTGSFNNEFKLAVAAGLELGYQFKLKNGHSLDLGVYADYTFYSMYNSINTNGKLITITPPSAESAAIVDVQSMTNAYANKFGFLDAGLKLTYNLDFIK